MTALIVILSILFYLTLGFIWVEIVDERIDNTVFEKESNGETWTQDAVGFGLVLVVVWPFNVLYWGLRYLIMEHILKK